MFRRMKKSSALLLVIAMVITVFGTAAASAEVSVPVTDTNPYIFVHDSDTPYWHRSPHRINGGTTPAVYHLVSGGTSLPAYCCDIETSISPGTAYKRLNLEDAGYYSAESAAHIRFILANGFWAGRDNLSALGSAAGAAGLTAAEALTATQAAIWTYANVSSISDVYWGTSSVSTDGIRDTATVNPSEGAADESESRITAVYNYLCSGVLSNTSTVAGFTGEKVVLTILNDLNSYDVTVKFGLKGTFQDAGSLKLQAELQNSTGTAAAAEYNLLGAGALTADGDGLYTVTFRAVDAAVLDGAKVVLKLNGTQNVQNGIYFYEPEGGRKTAQCFVGYGAGETPIYGETEVAVEAGELEAGLKKVDASVETDGAETPMKGVAFDLYVKIGSYPAVKYPGIETAVTGEDGIITWTGLAAASNVTYYYKENVPAGYVAENGEGMLVPGETVLVRNCHDLGSLSITKETPNMDTDSVNAGRHYQFLLELDYTAAQILQNSHEWPTVSVLEEEYGVLKADCSGSCEAVLPAEPEAPAEGDIPADPAEVRHPDEVVLTKEGNGIMRAVIEVAGGETITLTDIPAGAVYTITELDPDGNPMEDGVLRDFSGELLAVNDGVQTGIIPAAGRTAEVEFSNYVYGVAEVDIDDWIPIQKNLDGKPSVKAFQFVLTDVTDPAARKVVETKSNGVEGELAGKVDFAPITYTRAGTYIYEVHEVMTGGYICDERVYTVTVTVAQNDNTRKLEVVEMNVYLPQIIEIPADSEKGIEEASTAVEMAVQDEIVFENKTIYYDSGYTSLAVKKVWKLDDGGAAADAVTVNLLKNGQVYETVTLSAANNWSKAWYLLDDGYRWTVEEADVPEGFTASVSKSGFTWTITNDDIGSETKEEDPKGNGDGDETGDGEGGGNPGNGGNVGDDEGTGEELVLIEEEVPLANVPKTGNGLLAEILCIASGMILVLLIAAGKRKVNP